MRYYEFKDIQLSESIKLLVGDELFKIRKPMRTQIFIDKIKAGDPFDHNTAGSVIIPPVMQYNAEPGTILPKGSIVAIVTPTKEPTDVATDVPTDTHPGSVKPEPNIITHNNQDIFTKWAEAGNPKARIQLIGYKVDDPNKNPINIRIWQTAGDLRKTAEFGGSTDPSGKDGARLKPADIGLHKGGELSADALSTEIQNNAALKKTAAGTKVIEAAKQIDNEDPIFDLSELTPGQFSAFRDDAGEYLGPLMMFRGLATFKGGVDQAFLSHLGIGSLTDMKMFFPVAKNEPGADVEGIVAGFMNPNSGLRVMISVKGGKTGKGAAFSSAYFKIPEELKKKNPIATEFLELQKATRTNNWAFINANWLRPYSDTFRRYLPNPIPDDEINNAVGKKGLGPVLSFVLAEMKKDGVAKFHPDIDENGNADPIQQYRNIFYGIGRVIENEVNKNNVLPNLAPVVRETLQQNFIKLSNKLSPANPSDNNELISEITWPNRELGTGIVEIKQKGSMTADPSGRLSMAII